jgi:hypothetical protein
MKAGKPIADESRGSHHRIAMPHPPVLQPLGASRSKRLEPRWDIMLVGNLARQVFMAVIHHAFARALQTPRIAQQFRIVKVIDVRIHRQRRAHHVACAEQHARNAEDGTCTPMIFTPSRVVLSALATTRCTSKPAAASERHSFTKMRVSPGG